MSGPEQAYGVIFDMDGVLVDSYRPHFESWRAMVAEHGLEITEGQFARSFGRTSRDIIAELWGKDLGDDQIAALDERKECLYRQIIRNEPPVTEGLLDLLADLSAEGVGLALASSGPPENVDLVLDVLAVRKHFSAVVTGMDVTSGKPNPQVFLLAAERIGIEPTRCVVIEDAPAGIEAAHRAKMKAIAITTSHRADRLADADLVVVSLSELSAERIRALGAGTC